MTLKEKFNAAKAALGGEKADALIEQMEMRLEAKLVHFPTFKQRTEALEQLAIESRRRPAPSAIADPTRPAPAKSTTRATTETVSALCAQYQTLNSDEERRAFWRRNEKALSDPKAKVGGLVLVCMSAAKPLSVRARFQLPATGKATDLVMTKKDWLALSPYERGRFQVRGGKIVAETMKRSLWQRLQARDRADFCRDGGQLTDD